MKLSKKQIEQYHLRQEADDETDCMWADFNIEDNGNAGRLSIHSDYGDWSYYWGACGSSFKEFLTKINDHYLTGKLGSRTEFKVNYKRMREEILSMRREDEISTEHAREAWEEVDALEAECITQEAHFWYHFNDTCKVLYEHVYCQDYQSIPVDHDYPIHLHRFVNEVWPMFTAILKAELTAEPVAIAS